MSSFSDPDAVARYADGPPRLVPGFRDMQRMASLLLAERCEADARILVLGAGGGLELKAFAEWHPEWSFVGIDPSPEMLDRATRMLGPLSSRVTLLEGYIDNGPAGPFDGATCLLTLHFVPRDQRISTLTELRARLKPGAPLVVAHHSIPRQKRSLWLDRYAAFATSSGVPANNTRNAAEAIGERLPVLSPEEDEAMLADAGFTDISLFYAGFTFRGWVATNPG